MAANPILHLTGKDFSGRIVKLRRLLPSEIDECDRKAAQIVSTTHKDLPEDARRVMYQAQTFEEGIATFLVAYTAPMKPADVSVDVTVPEDATPAEEAKLRASAPLDPTKVAALKWVDAGHDKIVSGEVELDAVFTPKDLALIARQYSKMHVASPQEVEAIEGKAIELAAG